MKLKRGAFFSIKIKRTQIFNEKIHYFLLKLTGKVTSFIKRLIYLIAEMMDESFDLFGDAWLLFFVSYSL